MLITIPLYAQFERNSKEFYNKNLSILDKITIASILDDEKTISKVLFLTIIYSLLAYVFLISFCYEMSSTEFTS